MPNRRYILFSRIDAIRRHREPRPSFALCAFGMHGCSSKSSPFTTLLPLFRPGLDLDLLDGERLAGIHALADKPALAKVRAAERHEQGFPVSRNRPALPGGFDDVVGGDELGRAPVLATAKDRKDDLFEDG